MGDARDRRPWRWVAGIIGAVVIAVIAFAGWLLWAAAHNLQGAANDASAIKAAALEDDPTRASAAIDAFQAHAEKAATATDSPIWGLMTHAPFVGDDARGVRTAASVALELGRNALAELSDTVGDIDAVLPHDGGVDLGRVSHLVAPVSDSSVALDRARRRLDAVDPSGFVGALQTRFRDLQSKIDAAAEAMSVADRAVQVLPDMLGQDGPKNYLVVMQNNAEIRASGGLAGAVALMHTNDGKISMVREVAGSSFGEAPASVLPLAPAEQKIFGRNLGTFFLDANLTPDFARSAALWKARWEQTQPEKVDGVVSLDAVTLSYLLKATGPVEVGGTELTSANVVDELLSNVYRRIADPAQQDVFFGQVASTVFSKVMSFDGSRQTLLQQLQRAADERRIRIHDFDDSVQEHLTGTAVAGELTREAPTTPQVGVYFADATRSKMSYYLRYDTHVAATSCTGGVQTLSGTLTMSSPAPKVASSSLSDYVLGLDQPKSARGNQLVAVYLFAPEGGTSAKFDENSVDFPPFSAEFDGRHVIGTWVVLGPGDSQDLKWTMTTGQGQTGNVSVDVTPSVETGSSSVVARSACR